MVDATVSMVLNRLGPIIEKKVREEVCLILNANKEAETLSSKLKKIQEVLVDAEKKGIVDPKVKSWLEKLDDISYDIDEVLDEWDMDNLRGQLEDVSESSNPWEKVSSFLQSVCLCFKQSVERRGIAFNMKQLNERLDLIAQENENEFNFIPNLSRDSQDPKRIMSTSFVDVSEIHGRDDDLETLINNLLPKSGSTQGEGGIQIVSIIGAGGIGKTTLAQLAFNNDRMKDQFDVKIWVCVSHPFDEIKIAKAILEALNRSSPNLYQLETLLQCIKDSISEKKFLLVLDDVWTEDDNVWKPLKTSLIKNGAPGSKILVTTRNRMVAEIMGSTLMQWLAPLSDSYCWSILCQIAFHGKNDGDREMLKETGWEIALKCKGLPLAAKTLGSLLRFKNSLQEWQNVLKSEVWELAEAKTDLFPFLALSYNELQPAVKRCFSYCAIFPKDFQINVDELIRIWMAQGFLSSSGTSSEMQLKGRQYFKDLAMRSFFQNFVEDEDMGHDHIALCQMHDIVHDFAQFLTTNECLIVEKIVGETEKERVSGKKSRHLNLKYEAGTTVDPFSICAVEKLCSFFCRDSEIPTHLLSHLKRVKLLSLKNCNLGDIPSEIGNLIHLRYLDLSSNGLLQKLPETICDLYNLQTLDLRYCPRLIGLPQGMHKLVNLRHLLNCYSAIGFEFNGGFERLTGIQTLDQYNCGRGCNNKLGYLKDLNQLGGSVTVLLYDLDDEADVVEAKKANLNNKKFIQDLSLQCAGLTEYRIMEALQPPPNLLGLHIIGPQLPEWIATLTNLRKLFIGCTRIKMERWHSISNIPFLEKLTVLGLGEEHLGLELLGINKAATKVITPSAFPKLKILRFFFCYGWKEWEDISEEYENRISTLPSLEKLIVHDCRDLKSLPHRLLRKASSLQILDIEGCQYLAERYHRVTGEDWDKISHIPFIDIRS